MKDGNNMIQITGLWLNTTKDGNKYMTGNIGPGVKILVFKNNQKKTEKHPDYLVYFAPNKPKPEAKKAEEQDGNEDFV